MFSTIAFEDCTWETRPHAPGEPARHTAQLSAAAGFVGTRANLWRYEPGARGRRHVHDTQEETFVVLSGTLTMLLGEPPERRVVAATGLIHVSAGTPLQIVNEGEADLLLYAYGAPPDQGAEVLPDAG